MARLDARRRAGSQGRSPGEGHFGQSRLADTPAIDREPPRDSRPVRGDFVTKYRVAIRVLRSLHAVIRRHRRNLRWWDAAAHVGLAALDYHRTATLAVASSGRCCMTRPGVDFPCRHQALSVRRCPDAMGADSFDDQSSPSQPRIHWLAFQSEHPEDALVDASQWLATNETLQPFQTK